MKWKAIIKNKYPFYPISKMFLCNGSTWTSFRHLCCIVQMLSLKDLSVFCMCNGCVNAIGQSFTIGASMWHKGSANYLPQFFVSAVGSVSC